MPRRYGATVAPHDTDVAPGRLRIVGPGRAGGAFARALADRGWEVADPVGRGDDPAGAAHHVDLVLITTPDPVIAAVAAAIEPDRDALVVHAAGSLGLDVLEGHPRRGALHPLVSIPDPATGAVRLLDGAWFAVAADTDADLTRLRALVATLGGTAVEVADADRAVYHAAAVVASNHLVALFGQVQRIAASSGVPPAAFHALATQTLAGLATASPATVLTGPVRRGDWDTVARHLEAMDAAERPGYAALAELAAFLVADAPPPPWLAEVRRGDDPHPPRVPEETR